MSTERRFEIAGVILLAITAFLFLALITDGLQGAVNRPVSLGGVENALGKPGSFTAGILILLFGHAAHVIYCMTAVWAVMLLQHRPIDRILTRLLGLAVIVASLAGLFHMDGAPEDSPARPGGIVGALIGDLIEPLFGYLGAHVVAIAVTVIGVLLATEFLFFRCFVMFSNLVVFMVQAVTEMIANIKATLREREERRLEIEKAKAEAAAKKAPVENKKKSKQKTEPEEEPLTERELKDIRIVRAGKELGATGPVPFDEIPGLDIIEEPAPAKPSNSAEESSNGPNEPAAQLDLQEASADASANDAPPERESLPEPILSKKEPKDDKIKKLPRRKSWVDDDLPPDYEYPKRFTKPDLTMLEEAPEPPDIDLRSELEHTSGHLEETLNTFGVEARVTDVTRGPAITRFELEPGQGVKVSRFINHADDLALALKAHRVRVEAPIPGKGRVGIEVPNKDREPVVLRELLESREFKNKDAYLNLALGKDIAGEVAVADLATMPHLLVAGATGAGKTVCVKSMLASLLFNNTPDEMELILIDPKMVELSIFNDIPHLITPVVTDPKKASATLNWLIGEMEERYRLFAHLRVRNIEVYNESVENGELEMPGEEDDPTESMNVIRKLPYIVCVIDELADLMMLARSEVENAIARLAQLARAVGIHLVIATQRPSVDVLTGVIKANFPARISFQVSSRVDSRCILDEIGAERLIGQGDMLYLPAGHSKPVRVQGAFVSDDEMFRLISYLKTQAPPQYKDEIEKFGGAAGDLEDLEDFDDDLFEEAVRIVLDTGQASISMVQRKLRVGYTRAARLVDMMEQRGIVGPHVGSKAREILVDTVPTDEST